MFRNMKPLPKAILIGIVIALPIWAYTKFGPKPEDKPIVVQEQVKEEPVVVAPTVQEDNQPKVGSVTSGAAGLDAVLKAGKK